MILLREMQFTAMYNRMPVGEIINMPVQDNSPSYLVGIIQIVSSLDIVANVIPDDYLI
jgi:hypothetical protein